MHLAERNVGRLVLAEQELVLAAGHARRAADHDPVLGTVVMHLQAELLAGPDGDSLDLEAVAAGHALVGAPRSVHARMRSRLAALVALELLDHALDVLDTGTRHHEHRVGGLDDDVILHADHCHQPALGMDEVAVRVLQQHVAARAVAAVIGARQLRHEVPRAEVIPACVERNQDDILKAFHHRVVERDLAARGERLGVEKPRVLAAMRHCHRRMRTLAEAVLEPIEFLQEAVDAEHEHAAVPEIAAAVEERLCAAGVRLLDEALDAHRAAVVDRRAAAQVAEAGIGPCRLDAEGDDLARRGEPCAIGDRGLEGLDVVDRVIGRHQQHDGLVAVRGRRKVRRARGGGRGIARLGLQDQHRIADAGLGELLADQEAMRFGADHHRR